MPFIETAKHLGMIYITDVHGWVHEDNIPNEIKNKLNEFIGKLDN